jgi:hypothetical protein
MSSYVKGTIMKNILFCIICVLSLDSIAGNLDSLSPLREFYANRHHIANAMNNLSRVDFKDTSQIYTYKSEYLTHFIDSNYTAWKNNKDLLLDEFLYILAPAMAKYRKFQYYISDSITVHILASYLDYFKYDVHKGYKVHRDSIWMLEEPLARPGEIYGKKEKDWVRDALELLIYKTHFPTLHKQTSFIKDRLKKCNAPLMFKLQLLCLCSEDAITKKEREHYLQLISQRAQDYKERRVAQSEKDTVYKNVFRYLGVPLWVQAKLGDTEAEKRILMYAESNNVYDLTKFAHEGSFTWSDTIKTTFIKLLGKDIPLCNLFHEDRYINISRPPEKYQTCRSLQDSLIMALARHHPDEMIFSNFYSYNRINADFCKPELQLDFFYSFAKWIKKKYNYDLEYNNFKPYFIKDVSKDQSAVNEFCK